MSEPSRKAFEESLREFFQSSLDHQGVLGVHLISPSRGSNSREYAILRTFTSEHERDAFYRSDLFGRWQKHVAKLTEGERTYRELHGLEAWFHTLGAPPQWKMALTQLIGGILLIVGALTPLAALGIAGTMFTATVFLISRGEPFINPAGHSWENSVFYLTAGLCLALTGAGPWSLDAWLFGGNENSVDTAAWPIGLPPDNERERNHFVRRLT